MVFYLDYLWIVVREMDRRIFFFVFFLDFKVGYEKENGLLRGLKILGYK